MTDEMQSQAESVNSQSNATTISSKSDKKATPKKTAEKKTTASKKNAPKIDKKPARPFPITPLEKCLVIAQKIKEKNGGNAWSPKEIFKAASIGDSNQKWYCSASSRDFGITSGTTHTDTIELTQLGHDIVYAPNPAAELEKKREAFLKIPIFKGVLEHYRGSSLPEMQYLGNTLQTTFGLPSIYHEEFAKVFNENCRYLRINESSDVIDNNSKTFGYTDNAAPTVIIGEARSNSKGKLNAFIIMPFVEREANRPVGFFKEVLDSLITPAGVDAGFNVETARRQGSDVIQSTIINALINADLVIADLTDHNPNVLFELGVRIALDKPVALIKTRDTGRIFDVDNMLRIYEYSENLWKSTIETDLHQLIDHFKSAWATKDSDVTYMKLLRRGLPAMMPGER